MKLVKPIKWLIITQPFGVNYVYKGFYRNLGIPSDKHNGIDFRLTRDKKIFAAHNGIVKIARFNKVAGNMIKIFSESGNYRTRYLHLSNIMVQVNQKVKAGDLIGLGGDTGTACRGPHLHFDLRFFNPMGSVLNYDNGYHGLVDPMPYFEKDAFKLPIDLKYGRKQNWKIELAFRFAGVPSWITLDPFLKEQIKKGKWVHQQLIKMGRKPPLNYREMNEIIYGSWRFEEAIDPAMKPITYFLTRQEFKKGILPPIRLFISST